MPVSREQIFRLVLLAGFLLFGPVMAYYRLKSVTTEKLDRRKEGLAIFFSLRLAAFVSMVAVIGYLIESPYLEWALLPLPLGVRWAGTALGFLAGMLFIWTLRTLGPNLTDTVVTRRNHSLVTGGPYRWVRHPFYVATAGAVTAVSLISANALIFAGGVAIVAMLVLRTNKEEYLLLQRFGDAYRDYMRRTGRFLPNLFHS